MVEKRPAWHPVHRRLGFRTSLKILLSGSVERYADGVPVAHSDSDLPNKVALVWVDDEIQPESKI